jgi:hypothetical protein
MDFLIDLASLKNLSLVHENVENELLRVVLKRSQDMYIEPIVGTAQYNRLLAGVAADDLTANELTLINDYIVIVLCIAVELRVADSVTTEIRNVGVGVATEQNYTANTSNQMERTKDITYKDLTFYKNRLKRFLCENSADYPLFDDPNTDGIKPEGKQNSYSQNFFISHK